MIINLRTFKCTIMGSIIEPFVVSHIIVVGDCGGGGGGGRSICTKRVTVAKFSWLHPIPPHTRHSIVRARILVLTHTYTITKGKRG